MAGPIARWGAVLGLGVLWWWAVLRLALASDAGVLEGAVAAGWVGAESAAGALCAKGPGSGSRGLGAVDGGLAGGAGHHGVAGYHGIATPPFGRRIWPVVKDEASEAR